MQSETVQWVAACEAVMVPAMPLPVSPAESSPCCVPTPAVLPQHLRAEPPMPDRSRRAWSFFAHNGHVMAPAGHQAGSAALYTLVLTAHCLPHP